MIPYVGDAAKAAKYAAKGAKAVGKIGMKVGGKAAAKAVDVAVTAGKKLASVGDNVMKGGAEGSRQSRRYRGPRLRRRSLTSLQDNEHRLLCRRNSRCCF